MSGCKINNKETKSVSDIEVLTMPHGLWFFCDIALWQHRCFLFIGSRKEMCESFEKNHHANNLTESEIKFARDWASTHDNTTDGDAFGIENTAFIRLSDFVIGKVDDIAILSHKCLHVANRVLRIVGLQGDHNCEGLAYTQEFIFKSLLLQMMQQRGLQPLTTEEA